ncbi:ubiquitin-conjugating enzyme E2 [Trypanosoma theileri]|uniref:Ubiquitin-conjugating enzyme E2 n=1 Tax=Trypanosoma theileri TaxID=67003 RepID=A0A1X0PAA1_9TRYP|nr:ubiquitin-conjugating enzyme E2 [Trypanosoma theileri]ORC93519.1 ubiquitin-conjugating enzyme E2 [Trypanosoma theileri]
MPDSPTPQCVRRLQKELCELSKEPSSFCVTAPSRQTILRWYFILNGPPGTPYEGGRYLGKLKFPSNYPLKPPDIYLLTPNGRFKTDTSICLTMSSYHPENWTPLWGVRTILTGLLSFMTDEEETTGSVNCTVAQRKLYAAESRRFNVEQMVIYKETFPEEYEKDLDILRGKPEGKDGIEAGDKNGNIENTNNNNSTNAEIGRNMAQHGGARWNGLGAALAALFAMAMGIFFFRR